MNSQKLVKDIQNYCDSVNAYKKKIKEIQKTDKMSKKAFFFDMGGASLSYCLIAILCLMPIALLKGDILLALIMGCGAGLVSGFFGGLTELIASKGKGKIGRVALTNNAKSYPWKSMTYSNILRKGYVTYKDIEKLKKHNERSKIVLNNYKQDVLKKCENYANSKDVDNQTDWLDLANRLQGKEFNALVMSIRKLDSDLKQLSDVDTSVMSKEQLNQPIIIKDYEVEDFKVNSNQKTNTQTSQIYTSEKTYNKDDEYIK